MNCTASLSSWPRLCEEQRVLANVGFPKMGFTIFHRFAPVFILASNIFSTYCGYGSWRDCTWVMAGEEERLWQPWYKDFQRSHNGSGRDAPTEISRVSLETAKDSDTPMELCDMTTKLSTRSSTCIVSTTSLMFRWSMEHGPCRCKYEIQNHYFPCCLSS